jgi:hypothetical protein
MFDVFFFWGLRTTVRRTREVLEVCILYVGHSRFPRSCQLPSCVTAYPRGSRSRVFNKIPIRVIRGLLLYLALSNRFSLTASREAFYAGRFF